MIGFIVAVLIEQIVFISCIITAYNYFRRKDRGQIVEISADELISLRVENIKLKKELHYDNI